MQANEFEKQVQAKLEEFQLSPSASVWKNVEQQIREKKRRRIIFFLILPVALALLGFSLYQFLYTGNKTEQTKMVGAKENAVIADPLNIDEANKKQPVTLQQEETRNTNTTFDNVTTQNQQPANTSEFIKTGPGIQVKKKTGQRFKDRVRSLPGDDISIATKGNVQPEPPVSITADYPVTSNDTKNNKINPDEVTEPDKVPVAANKIIPAKTDTLQNSEDGAVTIKEETILKNKTVMPAIHWGIEISAGLSASHNGVFSFETAYQRDMMVNPSPATGGNSAASISSSPVRSGPAFSAGLIAELQVSKKSRISSGLQYTYASNRIKTGARMDTLIQVQNNYSSMQVDQVYRGPQQYNYTNSYHFVTIPVWYHWQINKGMKTPIQWNVGIDASYLIATNALIYDPSYGGIYYRNKDAFSKMHFNLGTGLSFRLGEKNKKEWVIGPEMGFDLSRLVKDNKKQYLLYGGINVKMFLPKKK